MKKMIALMLSLVLLMAFTACGGEKKEEPAANSNTSGQSEAGQTENDKNDTEEEEPAEQEEEEPAEQEEIEPAAQDQEEPAEQEETEQGTDDGDGPSDGLLDLLRQLSPVAPTEDIIGTAWEFSGGMIDGVEMEQAEAEQNLEMYSGELNIVFNDEESISMVQGGGTLNGTYGLTGDGYIMGIEFDNAGSSLRYAGLLTDVDGTIVLMLFSDDTGENAIYFTQITE